MRDGDLGGDLVPARHDAPNRDRPGLRVVAVELDDVPAGADPLVCVRPVHDHVLRELAARRIPLARLEELPQPPDGLAVLMPALHCDERIDAGSRVEPMRRLLFLVSSIVLVETIFFSALSPLLPHYSDEFGLSKSESGILVAAYALGGFVGAIPGGLFAQRIGVKPTVLFGLAVMSSMSVVFGFADSVWLLDVARLGQGFGSAFAWGGGLAWLVAAAPRNRRGELIGIAMGAAVGGALLGPVLGSVATIIGTGPAFSGVAALGAGLGVWAWMTPAFSPGERQPLAALFRAVREPRVAGGIWLLALPSLLFGVIGLLAPLRLDELHFSGTAIGAVFLVAAGFEVLASPLIGRWSDRSGRLAPARAFLVVATVMSLLLPWPEERWTLAALVVGASIAYGAFFVPGTALLSDGAEDVGLDQGFGFALLNLAWAPGHIVGSAAGGALADAMGDAVPYLILAGLCLATLFAVRRAPAALTQRAPRLRRGPSDPPSRG